MYNHWLIFHNLVAFTFFISCLGVGLFVYLKNPKKTLNRVFFALNGSVAFFYICHLIGVNAPSEKIALLFFNSNWVNVLAALFTTHLVIETIGESSKRKIGLTVAYVSSIFLIVAFLVRPELMIAGAEPKFHMPFYYIPGPWYLLMRFQNLLIVTYSAFILLKKYKHAKTEDQHTYRYLTYAMLYGYPLVTSTMLPIFDVNFPPGITLLFGAYTFIFAYGIFRYEVFKINIMAKKALVYGLIVTVVSIFIILINTSTSLIRESFPHFPIWLVPLASSVITTFVGVLIWNKMKEIDVLKYEFISVVTHKFRTPLTAIKWSVNMLKEPTIQKNDRDVALENIEQSEQKLVELLEIIMDTYNNDAVKYEYRMQNADMKEVVSETLKTQTPVALQRNIRIALQMPDAPVLIHADKNKVKFVVQTLVENAINYSPNNSIVSVTLTTEGKYMLCSIRDKGIGIAKEDLSKIFSKFYRGSVARAKDTEGMGVGLNLAHNIILRHDGDIIVQSDGVNAGSVFTIKLPLSR